ncbi:beta-1 adrenergic receptor-like [Stylophora pistillata]|uniref:beta-1 adrenergic receptor-like n=1 Tax=Stylophora pistillata TaxID=50429 RepID=UPI000C0575EE|nr:beta-1 adrenergic receptor-like [Stylophora pistillata]
MSNLVLPHRSLEVIITEAIVCLALNITSFIGNVMVCLAVFKNRNLRSTTNLYITALAISDLLCATVEMPLTAATLIIGRWDFGDAVCQIQGFVDAFATYSTPATLCLLAFNRYIRIVKTNLFSYYKVFSKTSEHELHMASSLRQSASDSIVRSSVREINITRVLLYIAAGFLCSWIPLWIIIFWRRFSPDTCPRAVALTCTMLLFVSASINPFIYMFTNGEFQREFRKLLRCRREARMVPAEILEVGDIER